MLTKEEVKNSIKPLNSGWAIIQSFDQYNFKIYVLADCIRRIVCNKDDPKVWNLATDAPGDLIEKIVKQSGDTVKLIGDSVFTVKSDRDSYMITSFNSDACGNSIEGYLRTKGFTVDAIAYDPIVSEIIDPFNGLEDIGKRVIKTIGDPLEEVIKQPVLILRAIRLYLETGFRMFHTIFGDDGWKHHPNNGKMYRDTYVRHEGLITIIKNELDLLRLLSPEEIRDELTQICMIDGRAIREGLSNWEDTKPIIYNAFSILIPGFAAIRNFDQRSKWHDFTLDDHSFQTFFAVCQDNNKLHTRLAALLHDIGKPYCFQEELDGRVRHYKNHQLMSCTLASKALNQMHFDSEMIKDVSLLISEHENRTQSKKALAEQFERIGGNVDLMRDLFDLQYADTVSQKEEPVPGNIFDRDQANAWLDEIIQEK